MPEPYTPQVGADYDPKAMQNLSPEQILHRSIVDPAFSDNAVGSTSYDWRKDYELEIRDQNVLKRVEKSLDALAATPEGRHHLRQAAAMQKHRVKARDYERDIEERRSTRAAYRAEYESADPEKQKTMKAPASREADEAEFRGLPKPDPSGKLVIVDDPEAKGPSFEKTTGRLIFNSQRPLGLYLGVDGKYHEPTLEAIIHHEIGHAKDPMGSLNNRAGKTAISNLPMPAQLDIADFIPNPDTLRMNRNYNQFAWEAPVIRDTNLLTAQYPSLNLGPARSLDHSATKRQDSPMPTSEFELGRLPIPHFPSQVKAYNPDRLPPR